MNELNAHPRNEVGKRLHLLRKQGFLPAVVYGPGVLAEPVAVAYKEFADVLKEAGESTLVGLKLGDKQYNVLIHDVAYDPLTDLPVHADFYAVRMDRAIRAHVPVVFVGESPAVKNFGGIMVKVIQELEVEALPQYLPHELNIDISTIDELGQHVSVKDIVVPSEVRVIADQSDVVGIIEAPRAEEELTALPQTPEVPTEVKTEREAKEEAKKKEEGEKTE
ncbi:MAG: 50S ribosomal protein L25 [Candidatus Sungbacteria bacterium]|nr:50S ribosomal protein L25 [Candidatus Sungbacteria bacterium]